MVISSRAALLKLNTKEIFGHLHFAVRLAAYEGRGEESPETFLDGVVAELKRRRIVVEPANWEKRIIIVGGSVFVQVVPMTMDLATVIKDMREYLHQQGRVLVGFIIRISPEKILWRRVEISQKWLTTQDEPRPYVYSYHAPQPIKVMDE
jgi:hypothetical protein